MRHVADRIDVDQRRDHGDHRQHDRGQRVEAQRPIDLRARPVSIQSVSRSTVRGMAASATSKNAISQHRRDRRAAQRDELRAAVADPAAEEAGDEGAEERQEDGDRRYIGSAFHQVDVFDRDRAAVAEVDDEDGEADRRLGRGDGEHEQREDLADQIAEKGREGDEVDVDESRISSTDIRMMMMFLRLRKMPTMPSVNRIAATTR